MFVSMKRASVFLFILIASLSGLMSPQTSAQQNVTGSAAAINTSQLQHPNQIIAKLKANVSRARYGNANRAHSGLKLKKRQRIAHCQNKKKNKKSGRNTCAGGMIDINLETFQITDPTMSVEEAIATLNQSGDYEYVEPDFLMHEMAVPNDPLFSQQWGLNSNHETDPDINAPAAWNLTTGGSDVVVAIIDGGVDYTHPDLAANMWTNDNEIPGDGIDNDSNGIVDDYYGFDARNDDGDPMDDRGHGTHLAGIIGAATNNGIGIAGINWNANIMAIKYLSSNGSGYVSDAIEGINYVIDMHDRGVNVKITNNSWGNRRFSQALSDAIGALADRDILFVASSGNDTKNLEIVPYYPAGYKQPNIMVVGMHGDVNELVVASNTGESIVDISAPGKNILSTALVTGASSCKDTDGDGYSMCTGTSMSAAYISGVAALVKSLHPTDSSEDLINRIVRSSKPSFITTRYGIPWTGKSVTGEIVDADGALLYNGLTAWPGKFYIEIERSFELDQPIQLSKEIDISSLSDNSHLWSLETDVDWITPSQLGGTVTAALDSSVDLNLESEFEFGLTTGHLTVNDVFDFSSFDIPITVRTRLQTLGLEEIALDSPYGWDEMGFAVDIDGDVAVISAPGENNNAVYNGAVHVYRQQADSNWLLEATLSGSSSTRGYRFGHDVAISGNKIIVGSGNDDSAARDAGAAYVFEYQAGQWLETQKLLPVGVDLQNDGFGQEVAIDGDYIVVGAPDAAASFSAGAADRRGSAYIYHYQGGQWVQQIKLLQPDTSLNKYVRFGAAVDIQGSKVLVSSVYHPDDNATTFRTSGRVHVYAIENNGWNLKQTIVPPESLVELFGYQVGLNHDELVISAPQATNQLGGRVGSIFTYNQSASGWELGQRISPPDIEKRSVAFGSSMDVDQDRIIVGAPGDGVRAINSGSVYTFKRTNDQWIPEGRLLPESAYSFTQLNYGRDVAVSSVAAVVGSGLKSATDVPTTGYLYAFQKQTSQSHLETITAHNVGADWVSVNLQNQYKQMVAVCTPHYVNNISPVVVRMNNVSSQRFEIRLQNPGDRDQVFAETVYCVVAEEGVWELPDGNKFEANKYLSSATAYNRNWNLGLQTQSYNHRYSTPVVLGQVMTHNDPNWSVFWSRGEKRTRVASAAVTMTGKHVGEDSIRTRSDEMLGYMVFENGISNLGNVDYQIGYTRDVIKHIGVESNYIPSDITGLPKFITGLPEFVIATQSGMDGSNGSWSVVDGFDALSSGRLKIAVDEDQIADSERIHITENVGFFTATEHLNVLLSPVSVQAN